MTKTTTPRFGQSQYSSGSDTLRRVDYNADGAGVELAAYDDGITYATLPAAVDTHAGRYVMHQPTGATYKTLYRATAEGGAWEQAVGTAIPAPLAFRPNVAASVAATATAATFTHPSLTNPGGTVTYDGAASFGRAMVLDLNDGTKTALHVGTNAAPAPGTLGRAHVRTTTDGDKGLVLQPHGAGAGNMFTAREPGGQDIITVDPNGYLRARSLAGFGGGALNAAASVVIAPTSSATDAVTTGLLLLGQSGAPTKRMLQIQRDSADTAPILTAYRDSITLGRLPWGDGTSGGTVQTSGRQLSLRALGYDADAVLWKLSLADATTPTDTTLDKTVLSLARAASTLRAPLTVTQELATGGANLTLTRFTEFNGRFAELRRAGSPDEIVSAWEPDGRLATGARWKGTGTTRDARQELKHSSMKFFGEATSYAPGDTFTYTWPSMQCRSVSVTDLDVTVMVQAYVNPGAFSDREDAQWWELFVDISVNGAAFTALSTSFAQGGPAHRTGLKPLNVATTSFDALSIAAGAAFRIRTRCVVNNSAVATVIFRQMNIAVRESLITTYTTP